MKKKIIKFFMIISFGFILGFVNSWLIYSNFWNHLFKGITSVPFYFHIIYIFLAVFFSILIHELGHLVSFKKHKIKIKGIVALGLAFIVIDNKIKVRFIPKFFLMIGGIVIPDHISIKNFEEEENIVSIIQKVLIAGPNTSLVYGIVTFLIWAVALIFSNYILNGFLFTYMVITSIMTLLVVASSKVSHKGMYGDYVAKSKIKEDLIFRLTYLLQVSSMFEDDYESTSYFWPRIIDVLSKPGRMLSSQKINILLTYLNDVTFNNQIGCYDINMKINDILNVLPKTEEGLLITHQLIYFYKCMNEMEKVDKLLNLLNENQYDVEPRIIMYHQKLTNHILGISDETEFLSNEKNIYPNSSYFLYKALDIKVDYNEMKL